MSHDSTPQTPQPSEMELLRAEMGAGFCESFKGVIDKTVATGTKVDRLISSNAIAHAAFQAFVTDHDVRITPLEKDSRAG
ncbi:MAG TPA: hypothetical protein VF921_03220 [Vicinamibacterales bacterium]